MHYYKLGTTDLMVPKVCFGANVFGWTLDERESLYMLDLLYDKGLNFIDTANNYSHWGQGNSGGESERIIGKWLKQSNKRDKVLLSTKVGGAFKGMERGLTPQDIRTNLEASLKRLNTDYIDLYFAHHDDLGCKQELTMHAFNDCVVQGKVRYLGASNFSAQRVVSANELSYAHGWYSYSVLQPLYNLYDRIKFETQYQSMAKEQNMAVMSYFALASGFLSGKYTELAQIRGVKREEMLKDYFTTRGRDILSALSQVANKHKVNQAEIAVAWQFTRECISTAIVSATSKTHLESIVKSTELTLDATDLDILNNASDYIK